MLAQIVQRVDELAVSGTPRSLWTTWLSSSLAAISSGTGISENENALSSAGSRISVSLATPAST